MATADKLAESLKKLTPSGVKALQSVVSAVTGERERIHVQKLIYDAGKPCLIQKDEVMFRYGYTANSTFWAKLKAGEIPAPVIDGSAKFWLESDVDADLESIVQRAKSA